MQLARQWFILLSTPRNPSKVSYGNRLGADQLKLPAWSSPASPPLGIAAAASRSLNE